MKRGAYKLHNDPQVAVITQLMIESAIRTRRWSKSEDYNELMVMMAIGWGRATGKLLDISSVANVVDLPRTTVKRILERLVSTGEFLSVMDGRRKVFFRKEESIHGVRKAAFDLLIIEQEAQIRRAARLLSKMEGSTLTSPGNSG